MKGKNLNIFVRFGGLDLKNQDGFSTIPKTYHSPPAPRGFYAFPQVAQEYFLIGSMDTFQPGTTPKYKEIDSYDEWSKKYKNARRKMKKVFYKSEGSIWHHLSKYTPHSEIIDTHGSWVKTSIRAWKKAFSKASLKHRYGEDFFKVGSINQAKGIMGSYSKDHCEVFFDEKV